MRTALRSWPAASAAALAVAAALLAAPTTHATSTPTLTDPARAVPAGTPRGAGQEVSPVSAAEAALKRLLPHHAEQFSLELLPRTKGEDYFTVSGSRGDISVSATTPAVALTGVDWYLKHTVTVDIGWPGESTEKLPATLPAPEKPVQRTAKVEHRFALNDTDDGYSGAYRDWAAFERQIDLLALRGVNEVFVQMGADAVYHETFKEFGYSGARLRSWIPGPAHQPWWLLQNMSGFGGPVSERLLDERAALGRKITDRLRELGMTPVLPGYFGTVPPDFEERNPGGRTVPQGKWAGFDRSAWLDPRTDVFAQVAGSFYAHQKRLLGASSMYKMDLLHEGGEAADVPVGDAARGVMASLQSAHPGAIWTLLGWRDNPPAEIVQAVDKSKLFIVDGLSDRLHDMDREKDWGGAPYAFGTIPNFGGHTTIGANTAVWTKRFDEWHGKPNSALKGIAYLPEGTGTNPAAFELFSELAWQDEPIDQRAWFAQYAEQRYGGADPHATKAWDLLRQGPYSMPAGRWSEPQDGLFTARPSLDAKSSGSWSPKEMRYDADTVRRALEELLRVSPTLRDGDAYRFDVVDVARQVLANHSRVLLPRIKAAYEARDLERFRTRSGEWRDHLHLLDRLLASDSRFLLGPWLEDAKTWAHTPQERARYEFDARSILTTWGHRAGSESGGLRDYGNREWSGLVSGFYAPRWQTYLDSLEKALVSGGKPAEIDWFARDNAWNEGTETYPVTPRGDAHARASEVRDAVAASDSGGQVS